MIQLQRYKHCGHEMRFNENNYFTVTRRCSFEWGCISTIQMVTHPRPRNHRNGCASNTTLLIAATVKTEEKLTFALYIRCQNGRFTLDVIDGMAPNLEHGKLGLIKAKTAKLDTSHCYSPPFLDGLVPEIRKESTHHTFAV